MLWFSFLTTKWSQSWMNKAWIENAIIASSGSVTLNLVFNSTTKKSIGMNRKSHRHMLIRFLNALEIFFMCSLLSNLLI